MTHPAQRMVQDMLDGMLAREQKLRASAQLTLGGLITLLEGVDGNRYVEDFGRPNSYRGYYCDLAFGHTDRPILVSEALKTARSCMGNIFGGWKGGDFQMGTLTPLWSADYGDTGPAIIGLDISSDPIKLVRKSNDEE